MQTSGTFPGLSDGVRKTVTTGAPRAPRPKSITQPDIPKPIAVNAPAHRSGGHAKHAKAGK